MGKGSRGGGGLKSFCSPWYLSTGGRRGGGPKTGLLGRGGGGGLTVVLLALVLVDGGDDAGEAEDGALGAAVGEDVLDKGALAGVGGEDADLGRWVAEQAHILVDGDGVFRLA